MLSWLFVKQNQYAAALSQERAVFKRTGGDNSDAVFELAEATVEIRDYITAQSAYEYLYKNSFIDDERLIAQLAYLEVELLKDDPNRDKVYKTYQGLIAENSLKEDTVDLYVAYARFLAFEYGQLNESVALLERSLDEPLQTFARAKLKMALADIMVFDGKFFDALIYYTQVQQELKNNQVGQVARFKVAQTSFIKVILIGHRHS